MDVERVEQLYGEQIETLKALYDGEWWTRGRALPDIKRMLRQSDIIVGYCLPDSSELVAFSRILTDYVYKALILDVIVAPSHRHTGLGSRMMEEIINHPMLADVAHFELYCRPELIPYYEQWGFTANLDGLCFMRRGPTAA